MYCRPVRKVKRYRTDPDELNADLKRQYNNLTLQDSKLHRNPFEALNEITVPAVPHPRLAAYKSPTHLLTIHQRVHLHKNPLKKLSDANFQSCTTKEEELPKPNKGPLIFKKSNPLFVVNTLMDILKEGCTEKKPTSCGKKLKEGKQRLNNQFSELEGKTRAQRGPRLVEAQLNLLGYQNSNFSRRKIYSEQKSRQKIKAEDGLVTFYKAKGSGSVGSELE